MIIIAAAWKSKPSKEQELKEQLEKMVGQVRANEPDCLLYTLHQGLEDKTKFFFYEQYSDQNAVDHHRNTAHLKALIANTETLIAQPVQVELLEIIK